MATEFHATFPHNSIENFTMTKQTKRLQGLPPIAEKDARVLILGAFVSEASLREQAYYADPRNQFWKIIEALFGIAHDDSYAQRCRQLTARGVAVWDVVRRCNRRGNSSSNIRDDEANDFADFYRQHPRIATVFFNGSKAECLYRRSLGLHPPAAHQSGANAEHRLISSAYRFLPLTVKIKEWRVLREQADAGRN